MQSRRTLKRLGPKKPLPVVPLCIGILVGSVLTCLLFLPFDGQWGDQHHAQQLISPQQQGLLRGATSSSSYSSYTYSLSQSVADGWHPIHVFYGKTSALGADMNQPWFSQVHQDEIVIDLIGEKGFFVDLASNDAKELSNTLALERHGWDGICIEPNPAYWYGLSHRKCTVVGSLIGDKVDQVRVKFRGGFGGIVGRMDEKLANRKKEPDAPVQQRFTAPFIDVLQWFQVPHTIDYMSLDVEGAEFLIMQHFPFDEYTIKVMTIERPSKELKELLGIHGYVFLKDLAWWGETLWAHTSTGLTPQHPKIVKIKSEERN